MVTNMNMANQQAKPATVPVSESAMLDEVHRRLVQIHYANAEATDDDRDIRRWTVRELMGVIREIGAFRRERRDASETSSRK
jgi:hypothetical protein